MAHDHPQVRVSPIFPVTDLRRALSHYTALGCAVSTHDEGYGFAAHLHVPDADALVARRVDVERTTTPIDTDYGLRENR